MPFDYTIHPSGRFVHVIGSGPVSIEDRFALVSKMLDDRSLPDATGVVFDLGRLSAPPPPEDLWRIGLCFRMLRGRFSGRLAMVQPTVGHAGIAQLIAEGTENVQVRAFLQFAEAVAWVTQSPDPAGV